jgi:ribonucleoside-diphosphate reductase alpha chain
MYVFSIINISRHISRSSFQWKKRPIPPYAGASLNALTVLERRYLKRDKEGKVLETPVDMLRRVAQTIAAADQLFDKKTDTTPLAEDFYRMMAQLEFLPNSPR